MARVFTLRTIREVVIRGNEMFNSIVDGSSTHTATNTTQRFSRLICIVAMIGLLSQSVGCVSGPGAGVFEEPLGGYRNHVWSNRAYNLRYGNCDREFETHFKQGFVDGYQDMCNGGDGYVPAVPPEEYWSYQYQSPEGAKCVNTWFKGYPLGVKAAREDGAGSFQKVYISKMIQSAIVQDKADHVLPDDVPVVTPEKEVAGQITNQNASDPNFAVPVNANRMVAPSQDPNFRK